MSRLVKNKHGLTHNWTRICWRLTNTESWYLSAQSHVFVFTFILVWVFFTFTSRWMEQMSHLRLSNGAVHFFTEHRTSRVMRLLRVCIVSIIGRSSYPMKYTYTKKFLILVAATFSSCVWSRCRWALPLTPRWPRCLYDVWARWRGAVSPCGCAKPAPGRDEKKKTGWDIVLTVKK